jgi:hypothetical protein
LVFKKSGQTTKSWYQFPDLGLKMTTSFWMQVLCQLDKFYGKDNEFWQQLKDHSSYDDFWQNVEFYNI